MSAPERMAAARTGTGGSAGPKAAEFEVAESDAGGEDVAAPGRVEHGLPEVRVAERDVTEPDVAEPDAAATGVAGVARRDGGPGPRRLGAAFRLLRSEVSLTFRRPRNIVMLGVLALVPILLGIGVSVATGGSRTPSIISQVAGNGLMLTFAAFFIVLPLILPLAVSVVAGDAIAGEANQGTLRYLLTAPAGRARLLALKYANVLIFCLAACTVVGLSALITGLVLFPVGPVTLLSGTTVTFAEGLMRAGLVVLYATAGMAALGALALAASTLTEAPIGAIAASVLAVVAGQVLGVIPQLSALEPYLLSSWWNMFGGALRSPMAVDDMGQGLLVFGAYILVFGSIAWTRFTTRDITS